MSNAVVPFVEMERMAATVAKSQLFGMKTPEQALALMCLAQAEGVHPMIAVRDYHLIDGKPTLKADTMLARFQESGGIVQWHCMTDEKCEATFTHPQAPQPIRLDWTTERATRAGLINRNTWKAYPRAMLRARLIAEGVRATYPAVIAGKYAPEEIADAQIIDVHRSAANADTFTVTAANEDTFSSGLAADIAEGHMSAIASASTSEVLRRAYAEAYTAARDVADEWRMHGFRNAYEARKAELQEIPQ